MSFRSTLSGPFVFFPPKPIQTALFNVNTRGLGRMLKSTYHPRIARVTAMLPHCNAPYPKSTHSASGRYIRKLLVVHSLVAEPRPNPGIPDRPEPMGRRSDILACSPYRCAEAKCEPASCTARHFRLSSVF